MNKYIYLIVMGLWSCTSDVSEVESGDFADVIKLRPILDLTPSESNTPRVDLDGFNHQLRVRVGQWSIRNEGSSVCMNQLEVSIQPRVVYGVETLGREASPLSYWSALIQLHSQSARLVAQIEIARHATTPSKVKGTVADELSVGLDVFAHLLKGAINTLGQPVMALRTVFESGSTAAQKMVLERMSLCSEPELDPLLDNALAFATDTDVRFRLVGLIGERARHGAAHQLIDLINLNDIEWTRSIMRTLSTLNHPRTLELISILAVHDSPALQKELKAALERLERK